MCGSRLGFSDGKAGILLQDGGGLIRSSSQPSAWLAPCVRGAVVLRLRALAFSPLPVPSAVPWGSPRTALGPLLRRLRLQRRLLPCVLCFSAGNQTHGDPGPCAKPLRALEEAAPILFQRYPCVALDASLNISGAVPTRVKWASGGICLSVLL